MKNDKILSIFVISLLSLIISACGIGPSSNTDKSSSLDAIGQITPPTYGQLLSESKLEFSDPKYSQSKFLYEKFVNTRISGASESWAATKTNLKYLASDFGFNSNAMKANIGATEVASYAITYNTPGVLTNQSNQKVSGLVVIP